MTVRCTPLARMDCPTTAGELFSPIPPEFVPQQDDGVGAGAIVAVPQPPAEPWLHSQRFEGLHRELPAVDALQQFASADRFTAAKP